MTKNIATAVIETLPTGVTAIYRTDLPGGDSITRLSKMQEIVGGYVETLDLQHPETGTIATMWMNEEGKMEGLPANEWANVVAIVGGWRGPVMGDVIVGTVFLTGFDPETGATLDLPDEWVELLARLA
jgi:hypothetical protein